MNRGYGYVRSTSIHNVLGNYLHFLAAINLNLSWAKLISTPRWEYIYFAGIGGSWKEPEIER